MSTSTINNQSINNKNKSVMNNQTTNNFELTDVQFKEYLTKEWLTHKDYWSEGATPEQLLTYTQPTEGDLECLVEYMINDLRGDEHTKMFHKLLNQALSIFNIK
jgi:hypothetical protein